MRDYHVKFAHPNEIYDVFYKAARQAIYNSLNPISSTVGDESAVINYKSSDKLEPSSNITLHSDDYNEKDFEVAFTEQDFAIMQNEAASEVEVDIEPVIMPIVSKPEPVISLEKFVPERNASMFDIQLNSTEEHPSYQPINNFTDYKIIGQIFNEFLILEKQDVMLLVDFHAGHERLLYDQMVEKINSNNIDTQELLIPYEHTLNSQEIDYICNMSDRLKALGFDVTQTGPNQISVSSVPVILSDINLKGFIENMLHDMNNKKPKINNELDRMLMQKACKSAVKSGMVLNNTQINQLLKDLDINRPVLLCPHGRPIVTIIKRSQLEKWFKRIV